MSGFTSVRKLVRYIASRKILISDMEDHYNMLNELNYDIRENLFPASFSEEHDRISREIELLRDKKQKIADEEYSIKIRERMIQMNHLMNYQMNGLIIMAPNEAGDIRKEGRTLRHCVGTYVEKVAKAKTNIFFIRKGAAPEIPYFTLEIGMNGNMIQCRGKNNCCMPDEVEEFVKSFTVVIKQYFEEQKESEKKNKKAS